MFCIQHSLHFMSGHAITDDGCVHMYIHVQYTALGGSVLLTQLELVLGNPLSVTNAVPCPPSPVVQRC